MTETNLTEEELIKIGKRHYNKIKQREYRRKGKHEKHSNNFYLKQGIHTLQVLPSLYELEKRIEELRYNRV